LKRANLRRGWSTIPKSRACSNKTRQQFTISRHASPRGGFWFRSTSALFEIALVLVRLDPVARHITLSLLCGPEKRQNPPSMDGKRSVSLWRLNVLLGVLFCLISGFGIASGEPVYPSKPAITTPPKKKRIASRSSPTASPAVTPSATPSAEQIAAKEEWLRIRQNLLAQIGGTETRAKSEFQLGSYSYRIDEMVTATSYGREFGKLQPSEGAVYVVVRFHIRNDGNATAATYADDFRLVDSDGREFAPDSRAMVSVSHDFILRQLHPGIWKKAIVIFEVPKGVQYRGLAIVIPEKGFGTGRRVVFGRWKEKKPQSQKSR
jgi:hypothetical protein